MHEWELCDHNNNCDWEVQSNVGEFPGTFIKCDKEEDKWECAKELSCTCVLHLVVDLFPEFAVILDKW